ncbi:ATP-dependent Clp protease ATP-binding subunit ClpC [Gimesia alba]|uniref:ATP-dependent Clp protease ATP-binding subunit ClpC n=1 Tax=Gimesia alba TaxID=2527973 RepID=A0A517RG38_9PLAN|nr:AAA family ATPase [Gimesia alba]QDT42830.1 ATP-dependent Clp protease ATP-binding subunit ClpC [Gimesia alba]
MSKQTKNLQTVLKQWRERDLTKEAMTGTLSPVFLMDDLVSDVSDVLNAGRFPILYGGSGVGKSAVYQKLVAQSVAGEGPELLKETRILKLSFRRALASLKKEDQLRGEFQKLLDLLLETEERIVPFFADAEIMNDYYLQPLLQAYAYQTERPLLAEGNRNSVEAMFENYPELESHFVALKVEEPDLSTVRTIVHEWSQNQLQTERVKITKSAQDEALLLTHRFLSRLNMPRKVLDLLKQVQVVHSKERKVNGQDVINRFHQVYKVTLSLIDPDQKLDLVQVREQFAQVVLGQDQAVDAVVRMIGTIKAGLSDIRRPLGAFLFTGPTGVGKTHIAQKLSEYLLGRPESMVRLNMADFQSERAAATLFGDPDEYSLAKRQGLLTQRLQGQSFTVLLLDEFEKCAPSVLDRFMQLIDEGCFINGTGESVSCRSTVIIATTNAGAELYRKSLIGFSEGVSSRQEMEQAVHRQLVEHFRFEFLNRFDEIVYFHALSARDIRQIAACELRLLQDRIGLKRHKLTIQPDRVVLDWLAQKGYDPYFGARFLRRTIERFVTPVIADVINSQSLEKGTTLMLSFEQQRIVIRFEQKQTGDTTEQKAFVFAGTPVMATSLSNRKKERTATAV